MPAARIKSAYSFHPKESTSSFRIDGILVRLFMTQMAIYFIEVKATAEEMQAISISLFLEIFHNILMTIAQ